MSGWNNPFDEYGCGTLKYPCNRNPPPAGYCQAFGGADPEYNLCGGTSGVHSFICCNNAGESCDGLTYQGASDGRYCGKGGNTAAGTYGGSEFYPACRKTTDLNYFKPFKCGGCKGQREITAVCIKKLYSGIPGTCWLTADCIENKCREKYGQTNRYRRLSSSNSTSNSSHNGTKCVEVEGDFPNRDYTYSWIVLTSILVFIILLCVCGCVRLKKWHERRRHNETNNRITEASEVSANNVKVEEVEPSEETEETKPDATPRNQCRKKNSWMEKVV